MLMAAAWLLSPWFSIVCSTGREEIILFAGAVAAGARGFSSGIWCKRIAPVFAEEKKPLGLVLDGHSTASSWKGGAQFAELWRLGVF